MTFEPARRARRIAIAAALAGAALLMLQAGAAAQGGQTDPIPTIRIPVSELDALKAKAGTGFLVTWTAGSTTRTAPPAAETRASEVPKPPPALPAETRTRHTVDLKDRKLSFTAASGAAVFEDDLGRVVAEIGYIAYLLDAPEPRARPVTFAVNGGPGAASAFLHVGALGPWRMPITQEAAFPTAPAELVGNEDSWLDLTDLVFIDPAGTGYSRVHNPSDPQMKQRFWSSDGDIASLALFVRHWLEANGRLRSPKVFLGQSYGGHRAPRIANTLATGLRLGLDGLVLVSPSSGPAGQLIELPFGIPGTNVIMLPTAAAAVAEAKGLMSADMLAAVERYAASEYLVDLIAGPRDLAAVKRITTRLSGLFGIETQTIERIGPRSAPMLFVNELDREAGRVSSVYDATSKRLPGREDAFFGGLSIPMTTALTELVERRIGWRPDRAYMLRGEGASWSTNQSSTVATLGTVINRDPRLQALVVHGWGDTVTPYFRTRLALDQLPATEPAGRIRLEVYGGGHMFYSRDSSRAAFRADGAAFFSRLAGGAPYSGRVN